MSSRYVELQGGGYDLNDAANGCMLRVRFDQRARLVSLTQRNHHSVHSKDGSEMRDKKIYETRVRMALCREQ